MGGESDGQDVRYSPKVTLESDAEGNSRLPGRDDFGLNQTVYSCHPVERMAPRRRLCSGATNSRLLVGSE